MKTKSEPLKTLNSVLSWQSSIASELTRCHVELSPAFHRSGLGGRTLVCHDMKGGYIEDRHVEGSSISGAYRFYHWQYVDIFVYFSHHLVTIPPPSWITAAHRHGVKVLGTFITEWNDGKATCEQFLSTQRDLRGLVNKLVDIMQYYRFDGWLVNIENVIKEEQVDHLREFLAYLTERCHTTLPGSEVIWYDSVVTTGELKWQNELNDNNRIFFDACDGIFLNYCWDENKLANIRTIETANERLSKVFVGVDVFGRGCPGGGGFNTSQAMESIRRHDLSAAIFAPGWVHETLPEEDFTVNQDRFWGLLSDHLTPSILADCNLATSFCQGWGQRYFICGQVVGKSSWYNLSLQQVQPAFLLPCQRSEVKRLHFTEEDGYLGGGCLVLESTDHQQHQQIDLFQLRAPVSGPLYVSFTVKTSSSPGLTTALRLTLARPDPDLEKCEVWLDDQPRAGSTDVQVRPLDEETQSRNKDNRGGWMTRCYCVEVAMSCVWSLHTVGLALHGHHPVAVKLGQIQITSTRPTLESGVHGLTLSSLQSDSCPSGGNSADYRVVQWEDCHLKHVLYYNVYHRQGEGQEELVRQCVTPLCTVCVNGGSVCVQTVYKDGGVTPLSKAPLCALPE